MRLLLPAAAGADERAEARRAQRSLVIAAAAGAGLLAGLLANGGGFLLVPTFLVVFGLEMPQATGTSLVVAAAMTVPTLGTHLVLGDIHWGVTGAFAAGLVPATVAGAALAHRLPADRLRAAFGVVLTAFALWFVLRPVGAL